MPGPMITRMEFLEDRQGRTFVDVANDSNMPFDELLKFFSDEHRQRRMLEAELHHDRSPLAGVVRELEAQPAFDQFFSSVHPPRTQRFRQAIGVIIRIIMVRHGWRKAGRKGSLGMRAPVNREMPVHNKGGLAFFFVRAERYELESGMPFRTVNQRRRELETAWSRNPTSTAGRTRKRMANGAKSPAPKRPKG
jgi:hypothetical protein